MHTDDHILEALVAAKGPLPAIAAELKMSFIALIRWMDAHADLIATAKRAIEDHIKLLSLRAEAVALIDLTNVSTSTANEERKRKGASQLLRHTAKRLLSSLSPPSPRPSGEKYPSTEGARGMRGVPTAPSANESCSSTNTERKLRAPCASASPADLLPQLARSSSPNATPPPSPRLDGEKWLSEAKTMRGSSTAPSANESCSSTNPERKLRAPCASASPADLLHQLASSSPSNAQWRMPNASSPPNAASSLLSSCGSAPALHQPDIVTQAVVAGLHMGMRIPGFTLADCAPPETS